MAKPKQPHPPSDDFEHFGIIAEQATKVFFSLIHQSPDRSNYYRDLLALHNMLAAELDRVRKEIECQPPSKTASTR